MLIVDRTGAQALLQDLGREGQAQLGVSPSGAADRTALRLANRLVGNPEGAAAIECLLGGLRLTAHDLHWVAVTGAPTEVVVNGTRVGSHSSFPLRPGDRLSIEMPAQGLRSYLAVRGGFRAPRTLGSRSTDVLSGLGPDPLQPGQELAVRPPRRALPSTDLAPVDRLRTTLRVLPGPRRDWFTDDAWQTLMTTEWQVSSDSNRVAVRLGGGRLERSRTDELPSEAMVRGAVQVPSSGEPLIFGPDHPITGGYPVIAVLTDRDADHAGQLRPGGTVRFTPARERLPVSPGRR